MSNDETCSACGGAKHLRGSMWHGPHKICEPCFIVWYDPDEAIDVTSSAEVGALSLKLKAAGRHPWTGKYADPSGPSVEPLFD